MIQVSENIGAPGISQNDQLATALAETLRDARPRKGNFPVPGQLKKLKEFFQPAYGYFESTSKTAAVVSGASDWLLDNFYILEQAIRVVEEDLPSDYYARLPKKERERRASSSLPWPLEIGHPGWIWTRSSILPRSSKA